MNDHNGDQHLPTTNEPVVSLPHQEQAPLQPEIPSTGKMKQMLTDLTMMAVQHTKGADMFSGLDKDQKDKMIGGMLDADKREHEFAMSRLEASKQVRMEEIKASRYTQKTSRILWIAGIFILAAITGVILGYKSEFFHEWISFIFGGAGGFGLSKISTKNNSSGENSSSEEKEEK